MLPGLRSMHPHSDSIAGHGPPDEPAPSLSAETEAGVEPVAEALGILEGKRHQGSGYVSAHALDDDPDLLRHGGLSKKAERQLRQLAAAFRKDPNYQPPVARPPIKPGTRLLREWQGEVHEVIVAEHGYRYRGTLTSRFKLARRRQVCRKLLSFVGHYLGAYLWGIIMATYRQ